ncbi:pyrroloquinoline quinone biosynthesis peptide chaperone PqqD [Neobacillus pocheonensis]|uniref:pyrroloquinoline quinone biosynthesis peptide chaperone PqqD n=1 Tax=Neobacillus pocheonensis TaxID=363869 RepID=UPI003D2B61B6
MPSKTHIPCKRERWFYQSPKDKRKVVESILADSIPRLAAMARLKFDKVREKNLLLLPEKVVVLNETAATILTLCDGRQTVNTITEKIRASLKADTKTADTSALPDLKTMKADISEFLREMEDQGWVVIHKHGSVDNKE